MRTVSKQQVTQSDFWIVGYQHAFETGHLALSTSKRRKNDQRELKKLSREMPTFSL
jgi:hypothetical protein